MTEAAVASDMSVTSAILHGVTCRKAAIFIATAMRILNLIDIKLNI